MGTRDWCVMAAISRVLNNGEGQALRETHGNRQRRNKRDRVVAFGTDFSNRRSRILLRLLHREMRAGLHPGMPSWLPTWFTGRAIRKTIRCIGSSPGTCKV